MMARLMWWKRGHRAALLARVMVVVTVVALLQYYYSNNYALSSQLVAHSTLSKLETSKNHSEKDRDAVSPAPATPHFMAHDAEVGVMNGTETLVDMTDVAVINPNIDVETEGQDFPGGDDHVQALVLHHAPGEMMAPAPQVKASVSLEKLSPRAATQDYVPVEVQREDSTTSQDIKDQLVQREDSATSQEINDQLVRREDSTASQGTKGTPSPLPAPKVQGEEPTTASQEISPRPEPKGGPIFRELQACRQAINDATPDSVDPSLYEGVYKNVTAFSKSYELMEQVFKVYTYRDGRPPLVHTGPVQGIYASEGQFIERLKHAPQFHARDPARAHMFFLPYSVQHMVRDLYVPDSHTMLPLATFIKEYVEAVARRYPFWNRSQGADHFFVSCHDWGPATARDHPALRTNATKVVCNADLTEEFHPHKDASLPEVYIHYQQKPKRGRREAPPLLGGPGWSQRPFLAFFAGQMHGRVRPVLLRHWQNKDPAMQIHEILPTSGPSYESHMQMSKFCICAAGFEVNSPRIVEAIYYDCVPVIIADHFVLPFSDVLDWEAFSITVPEAEIGRLREVLSAVPERRWRSMQTKLRNVRRHFLWGERAERFDCFHMVLHSVWMSRLRRVEEIRSLSSGEFF